MAIITLLIATTLLLVGRSKESIQTQPPKQCL